LKQAKGFFGRRKNVWTVAKNAVEKAMVYAYAIENKTKEISVHCGFSVLTLVHV
jgi:ribosomal protein L20